METFDFFRGIRRHGFSLVMETSSTRFSTNKQEYLPITVMEFSGGSRVMSWALSIELKPEETQNQETINTVSLKKSI
jgi:hypothetical protein